MASFLDGVQPFNPLIGLQTAQGYQGLANQAVQGAQGIAGIANTQANTAQTQFNMGAAQSLRAKQILFGLMNRTDSELQGGGLINKTIDDEVASGLLQPNEASILKSQLPTNASGSSYRPVLNSWFATSMSGPEAVSFLRGNTVATTTPGGSTQFEQIPGAGAAPGTPVVHMGTQVGGGMGAAEGTDIVNFKDSSGVEHQIPRAAVPYIDWSRFGLTAPPPAALPAAKADNEPTGTQTMSAKGAPAIQGMPGGLGGVAGPGPLLDQGKAYNGSLLGAAQNVAQNKTDYQNLLSELGSIQTGPGTDKQAKAAAFLQKWAGNPMLAGLTTDQLAQTESFHKISQTIANRQAGVLSGSDQSQASSLAATPNLDLSTPGNTQIIHKLLGNEDAIQAKAEAWNEWQKKHGITSFNDFSTWWNKNIDVRSFQKQYMNQEEQTSLLNSVKQSGNVSFSKFKSNHTLVSKALQDGWASVEP